MIQMWVWVSASHKFSLGQAVWSPLLRWAQESGDEASATSLGRLFRSWIVLGRRRSGSNQLHSFGLGMPTGECCWGHVGRCWNCDYAMVNLVKHYKALLSSFFQSGPLQMVQHVADTRCVVVPVGDISCCAPLHNLHFLDVLLHMQTVQTLGVFILGSYMPWSWIWESWFGGFSKWSSGFCWPCW